MLTSAADRLPAALADLDPGSRALLDLSLRRGISATEIGELLRKDPEAVEQGVGDVLELLADALGVEGDGRREQVRGALEELPEEAWQARPPARLTSPPAVPPRAPAREKEPEAELPYYTPRERRPSAWPIVLLVTIVAALVVGGILLFSGGDDDQDGERPASPDARQPTEPPPTPKPGQGADDGPTVKLLPLHGQNSARGKVTLNGDRDRLDISISGLPQTDGSYEIWVYSSIVDSKSLGSFRDTGIELDARLPDNLENYRYVDVSREPADGNPNHSGASVMRAPVDDLLVR